MCDGMARHLLQPNPDTAMPLGAYTNPPPPVTPFLFTLNQSPKDIADSDITWLYLKLHDANIGG